MVLKFGIIGYRNHAARLISLLDERDDCDLSFIYHPSKKLRDNRFTNDISNLLNCDSIFISSPNHTHYDYLEYFFKNYEGYLFCEKPPVTNVNHIRILEQLSIEKKEKTYFNFNYRFSEVSKAINNLSTSEDMGRISHIDVISTHGLSFKKEYARSWRADNTENLHNILETVSIHFLDMLVFHFGKIKNISYFPNNISGVGKSFDTCLLTLEFKNGLTSSIFNSYASPYLEEIRITGTNGYSTIRDQQLSIFSPRDTFNSEGFFIHPPLKHKERLSFQESYQSSLINSLDYFIHHVNSNQRINTKQFSSSIESTQLILNLKKDY